MHLLIHEKPVNAFGGTGYGYSIIDPETGAGYIIEGVWEWGGDSFRGFLIYHDEIE
jgi:hypothetical protein